MREGSHDLLFLEVHLEGIGGETGVGRACALRADGYDGVRRHGDVAVAFAERSEAFAAWILSKIPDGIDHSIDAVQNALLDDALRV